MKKFWYVLLCLPLTAWAQPRQGLRALKTLSTRQITNARLRTAPQLNWIAARKEHTLLQLLSRTTPPAGQLQLHKNIVLSATQHQEWQQHYQKILAEFEQFKKESSAFLFYQSIPAEMHALSIEEIRQWLSRLRPLHSQILKFYLTTNRQDAALQYALDYVEHAISVVAPHLTPTLRLNAQPLIAHFNVQEFFLYPPEKKPLANPSKVLEGKKIAVINDDSSLLNNLERQMQNEILLPGATLHTEGETMQFLIWFQTTSAKPDIVFTDIQLGDGNGYYIAQQLRESGYKGGIVALTSYAENEANARQLKAAGFDGMISLDESYNKISLAQRITQAAQVYLEQINKNQ